MNFIGFVQALLLNISLLAGSNDPQHKVTPVGFLQALLENPTTATVSNAREIRQGLERELKVRYMQRGLESDVEDVDDCNAPITPTWQQSTISRPFFSKIGITITDEEMRKYQEEANQVIATGQPSTAITRGLYEVMLVKLNGLIQKINANLLSAQAAGWGKNIAYGDNAAHILNFGNTPTMNDGIVKMMLDYQLNEAVGDPMIVGNGVINAYQLHQSMKAGLDSAGFGAVNLKIYNDIRSASQWGANHFGVFAPGLVSFVDFNRNVAERAGERGGSFFFTIPIPMQLANGTLGQLVLDAQLKYNDCPVIDEDTGDMIADRGWSLILSKSYGLWNAPNDMFSSADRLSGFNGSLHYIAATT